MAALRRNHLASSDRQRSFPIFPDTRREYRPVSMTDPSAEHSANSDGSATGDVNTTMKAEVRVEQSSVPVEDQPMTMWNPLILHSICLIGVMGIYIATLAAVVVLYQYSEKDSEFLTRYSSNHYALKYGPMAIIVLIAGIWHQVDYHCRSLAPWQSLFQGPKPAPQTVSLDYISPLDAITCLRALQNRHWTVAASAAGTLLLDIALIFSTALLVRLPVVRHGANESFVVGTEFSTALYNLDDSTPGMIIWGNLNHGLSLPFGTTDNLAFATPILDNRSRASEIVVVNVRAFVPHLSCEPAPVNVSVTQSETNSGEVSIQATVLTPTCDLFSSYFDGASMLEEVMPARVLTAEGDMTLCADESHDDYQPWSFIVIDMRYWQTFGMSANETLNVTYWSVQLENASAIVCQPSYDIRDAAVSIEVSSKDVLAVDLHDVQPSIAPAQLDGFNNYNFSLGITKALEPLYQQFEAQWSALDLTRQDSNDAIFALMSRLNDTYSLESFLDTNTMMDAAQLTFDRIAAQMAHHGLSVESNSSTTGTTQYVEQRIVVKLLPTLVLCVAFGVLVLLSGCILYCRVRDVTPQSPQSILGLSAILAASTKLHDRLQGTGSYSDEDLNHHLYGRRYISVNNPGRSDHQFSIEEVQSHEVASPKRVPINKWWRPFSGSTAFVILTAVCLVGVIVGLEVIRHFSTPTSGFLKLQISQSSAIFWSTIVPTAVMVLVKLLLQSLNFAILVFSPFVSLKKQTLRVKHILLHNIAGQLPVFNIWQSMWSCQLAILLMSAAVMLSSILTIIVSGLYSVQEFELRNNLTVKSLDYFDPDWNTTGSNGRSFDNQAGNIFTLIDWYNLSYPALTHGELAFPKMMFSELVSVPKNGTRLQVSVPATRASLDCSFAIPDQATSIWNPHAPGPHTSDTMVLRNQIHVPDICSMKTGSQVLNITTTIPAEIFLREGQFFSVSNEYPWTFNKTDYPGVCPSFGFTFGFTGRDSNSTENITSLTCYQMMEEVDTITTFLWPSLVIDHTSPPVVDESSMRIIVPHADYKLNSVIAKEFGSSLYAPLEPFFLHVINGTEGIPVEQLLGPENQERLLAGVQHVYRKYMAQAISLNMRVPVTTTQPSLLQRDVDASARSYQAAFLNPHGLCIVQNKWPRIVLEALLATMLVFALVAFLSTPMKKVLPHNPLTIAGTMSLVADGLLGRDQADGGIMPEGAEHLKDTHLRRIVEGYGLGNIRMGWWRGDGTLLTSATRGKQKNEFSDWRESMLGTSRNGTEYTGDYFGISILRMTGNDSGVRRRSEGVAEMVPMLREGTRQSRQTGPVELRTEGA